MVARTGVVSTSIGVSTGNHPISWDIALLPHTTAGRQSARSRTRGDGKLDPYRCPTCLFVLTGPEQSRCPSCHKRLRRRGRRIVLGGRKQSAAPEPANVELVPVRHTTVFAPSQFDPGMRQVLDDLSRQARAEVDEDFEDDARAGNESA